ncbi:DUF2500 domain-containing protein [Salmonella enterica]|nr:DUF2500 domain-containing protein [Salmonella enterica]EEH3352211.1 DUF2500 domain-containing protein [Salmonella enterica subsp. enterica serovar Infantis]EFP0735897.1 DUF2500 domain-containing protein [Salmonella enterica subsp. enterica serovar Infantis]EFP2359959.1 DUF2500 domain-containing protein [Salmonella enterica subsp. enterica serovar Infantis]EFR3968441.1 DUF2500 domain-containing protein [Salmonella enterica subsp. enterica serovar Infantis]
MSKPPLFFIIIIALIVVAASFRFVQQRREKAANEAAPLQQKQVVVSNKREKPLNGGLEKTFRLQAQQYHALTVGDQGTLSYKGTRFVGFVSRTPDNE